MTRRNKKSPAPGVTILSDGRYRVRAVFTDPRTGQRKDVQQTLPHGSTLGQAVDLREALMAQLVDSTTTRRAGAQRFDDFAVAWLNKRRGELSERSLRCHEAALSYALPVIGHIPCDDIQIDDLERIRTEMERADLARSTGTLYWGRQRCVVREAMVRSGYMGIDPYLVIKPPRCKGGKPRTKPVLTQEQAQALVDIIEARMARCGALRQQQRVTEVRVLLGSGLRIGELMGLRWDDVGDGTLKVRPEVDKTRRGRTVAISAEMGALLRAWRRAMVAAQHPGLSSGMVFPAIKGPSRQSPSGLYHVIKAAAAAAGFPEELGTAISPHATRRTYNKLALEAGADPVALRAQLGHSSASMTALYLGTPTAQEQAQVARVVGLRSGTSDRVGRANVDEQGVDDEGH